MTFGNVEFHLPIGLPLCEAIQVILQDLAINGGFYIPIQIVFPPALKKGMVNFPKKDTFSAWRHAKRALLSAWRHAKRALKMILLEIEFDYMLYKQVTYKRYFYASC